MIPKESVDYSPEDKPYDEAWDYVAKTLRDGDITLIHIMWRFDEQQADPFHRGWTADKFLRALDRVIKGP